MAGKKKKAPRIVNLRELADLEGMAQDTLRSLIRSNDDFPVLSRGQNGIAYEFDLDEAHTWIKAHKAAVGKADADRRDTLDQYRLDVYGPDTDQTAQSMSPLERRQLADAIKAEDYNRARRGELVERSGIETLLASAFVKLRTGLLQVPVEFGRECAIAREDRDMLERMIVKRINALAEDLAGVAADADDIADAA